MFPSHCCKIFTTNVKLENDKIVGMSGQLVEQFRFLQDVLEKNSDILAASVNHSAQARRVGVCYMSTSAVSETAKVAYSNSRKSEKEMQLARLEAWEQANE